MGFFGKKKQPSSVSSLTENEIQKKLYGEFFAGDSGVITREKEIPREPLVPPAPAKETFTVKREEIDLFSLQKGILSRPDLTSPPVSPSSPKSSETITPRPVPGTAVEQKPVLVTPKKIVTTPYSRFPGNAVSNQGAVKSRDLWKSLGQNVAELYAFLNDPKQVVLRRVLYWGLAGLAVFLLFWGVNVLNSQRELAMRTRYKMAPETSHTGAATASVPAAPVVAPAAPVEREVVITPVPVKTVKPQAPAAPSVVPAAEKIPISTYVIQVVTYPAKTDADQVVLALKREGLRAYVKESARSSGGSYYLVLIGGFRTQAEAQAQLVKFRAKEVARPFPDAFVKVSRS